VHAQEREDRMTRQRKLTKDPRPMMRALTRPPFGDPADAAKCPKCDLWYPTKNFYRGKGKPPAKRCRACIGVGPRPDSTRKKKPTARGVTVRLMTDEERARVHANMRDVYVTEGGRR